jgi:hypothetical protein
MMDHDDMKEQLLNELMQHLMESKEPDHESSEHGSMEHDPASMMADKLSGSGMGDDCDDDDQKPPIPGMPGKMGAQDPKSKIAMLAVSAKPETHAEEPMDMKKSLGPADIMMMKRKHMGL